MIKKLKIGFVSIPDASLRTTWSGTPFNILETMRSISDVEVELISPLKTSLKWLYAPQKLRCRLAKENYDWQREKASLRYFASQVEKVVRQREIDVVFSTSSIPVTELSASIPFAFWTDAVFHTLEGYYPGKWAKRTSKIARRQEERALSRAAFSCYPSLWAANSAKQFVPADRVKVLPFGPNIAIEHGREEVLNWIRQRGEARKTGCKLLYIGMNWMRKGGPIALEAARQLNNAGIAARLQIVGELPSEPLPPFVEAVGFLDKNQPDQRERFVQLLRSADILILPSRAECFGIAVVEAAAFGVPAVVTETGGLSDTVREGASGFRVPIEDNGTQFAERIQQILSNYEQFAKAAYQEYEGRMNWKASVERLIGFLRQAAHDEEALRPAQMAN